MLILKTVNPDMTAYNGFVWPGVGETIEAPDWNPSPVYGGGLHGLAWGEGDGIFMLDWEDDAVWIVFEPIDAYGMPSTEEVVAINDEAVKCRRARVLCVGTKDDAIKFLFDNGAVGRAVVGAHIAVGDDQMAIVGDCGQATAGYDGQAVAGVCGQAAAGDYGRATVSDCGQAVVGEYGVANTGFRGQAVAGDNGEAIADICGIAVAGREGRATAGTDGVAVAGYDGKAIAGDGGLAIAGDKGMAIAGAGGIAIVGQHGRAAAGVGGRIIIRHGNDYVTAMVGKTSGIKADTLYWIGPAGDLQEY